MKLKSVLLVGLIFSIALLSAACSTTPATTLDGDAKDQVVATVDPFAKDILDGINNKDYTTFIKDFNDATAKALTQDKFNTITDSLGKLGAFKGYEVDSVESEGTYYRVNYKVTYESGSFTMRVVIPKEGTPAVTGLWFK
jgi:hypothetical protein